jgi:hypothetical protein
MDGRSVKAGGQLVPVDVVVTQGRQIGLPGDLGVDALAAVQLVVVSVRTVRRQHQVQLVDQ